MEDRGCCYDDTHFGFETKWCFYPTGLYTVQRKKDHFVKFLFSLFIYIIIYLYHYFFMTYSVHVTIKRGNY